MLTRAAWGITFTHMNKGTCIILKQYLYLMPLLLIFVGVVGVVGLEAKTSPPDEAKPINLGPTTNSIQGMWVWRQAWINTDQAQDELLAFCNRNGFNRLFVQIHEDKDASSYTIKYPRELTRLVAMASEHGIVVEALDGHHDMAIAEHHDETLAKLDAVIDLNQSMPVGKRFVGIHYDIEPYVGDIWKSGQANRDVVMLDLLVFYNIARQRLQDRGSAMLLACDIPMWYDAKIDEDDHCMVTFQGQTKNLHKHIQDLCDYIGIMSYRTNSLGSNSVTYHVANELAYAESIGKTICASLETIELEDTPQITFFGNSKDVLQAQINLLNAHHAESPGYAGVLIHCYRGLRDMYGHGNE